jgi:hypothetical protein
MTDKFYDLTNLNFLSFMWRMNAFAQKSKKPGLYIPKVRSYLKNFPIKSRNLVS